MDGVLNYPMYYRLTGTFNNTNADMSYLLEGLEEVKVKCRVCHIRSPYMNFMRRSVANSRCAQDIFTLGTFTENQDVPRFASQTQDLSLARNIITYNLLGDGIPIRTWFSSFLSLFLIYGGIVLAHSINQGSSTVYYGQELHLQGPYNPLNRGALWLTGYANDTTSLPSLVQSLNRLRAHAAGNGTRFTESSSSPQQHDYLTYVSYPIHNTSHTVAFRKGYPGNQVITVLSNLGSRPSSNDPETSFTLPAAGTGFHPHQNVTEILSCRSVLTDGAGNLNVNLADDGGPRVYYPTNSLNGSVLCGHELKAKSSASSMIFAASHGSLLTTVFTMLLFLTTEMMTLL
ncbi:hypothetical protein VTN77DRAFT_775 [Rasamsonia byssochlamydoides]|uniref:uncharacterized protein n=1 Tax=Rasamsonia byssochlamydoides TaxID=89139 RepID=UPI0037443740